MTTKTEFNPWKGIAPASKKRCINGPDIYWHVDEAGLYCLRFENVDIGNVNFQNISLAEIDLVVQSAANGISTISLKLLEPVKHELFYFLSSDLITHLSKDVPIPANKLKVRLQRWIDLWKKQRIREMPLIAQMNLYSELYVLFGLIAPQKGLNYGVLSWRGPDKDKQDFDLTDYLVEVKSILSTSNKYLRISSAEQLTVRAQPIRLAVLQLSQNPHDGQSISELIDENRGSLDNLPTEVYGLFYSKLFELGYYDENDAPIKFTLVSAGCYYVEGDFPLISALSLSEGIDSVEYRIKVDSIQNHERHINQLVS